MRLMKMLGLAALVAVAAMAFLGASSASATGITALCKTNESPCSEANQVEELHMTLAAGTEGILHGLSPLYNVLCLNTLTLGEVLGPGTPQQVHLSKLDFTNCGTNSTHTNCEIKQLKLPVLVDILKTGAGLGEAKGLEGETLVKCTVPLIGTIDCIYEGAGLSFQIESANHKENSGHGMLNAAGTALQKTAGSGFCAAESTITQGLLEPLTDVYVSEGLATSLCVNHKSSQCAEKDQLKSLEMAAAKPPILLNSVANVECDESAGKGTASGLSGSQEVKVTELSWSECHTQGAADNCTVTNKALPTWDITRTALNVGTASTASGAVELECEILDLFQMDCVYPWPATLDVEGALHTEATGNGKLSADKMVVELTEGSEHCPETAKWDLSFEPSEEVYVLE